MRTMRTPITEIFFIQEMSQQQRIECAVALGDTAISDESFDGECEQSVLVSDTSAKDDLRHNETG